MPRRAAGFTLIELLMVVMLIGVMASIAIPQYLGAVEGTKFDAAVAMVNQIGTTNKMFALDHNGVYAVGAMTGAGCGCAVGTCAANIAAVPPPACSLVCCNYLSDQNWGQMQYLYYACDAVAGGGGGTCAIGLVSAAARDPAKSSAPYRWTLTMSSAGTILAAGGTNTPPTPSY